jgi:hypothetical protein
MMHIPEGHDVPVIETHAIEDVAQVLKKCEKTKSALRS